MLGQRERNRKEEQIWDFIFYPETPTADRIILELKVDHSPEEAIQQIKEKNYMVRFLGKLAQKVGKTQRILLVGIGYDKVNKKHRCKVEAVENYGEALPY